VCITIDSAFNRALAEWPDLFQNPLLASAALDRLTHHVHQIVITGDSFRAQGRRRASVDRKES
jgi:DNA replication protein DnaC